MKIKSSIYIKVVSKNLIEVYNSHILIFTYDNNYLSFNNNANLNNILSINEMQKILKTIKKLAKQISPPKPQPWVKTIPSVLPDSTTIKYVVDKKTHIDYINPSYPPPEHHIDMTSPKFTDDRWTLCHDK